MIFPKAQYNLIYVENTVLTKQHILTKSTTYKCSWHKYCTYTNINNSSLDFFKNHSMTLKLECGPMPNVMAALPNIGGALCSTTQSLADAHY